MEAKRNNNLIFFASGNFQRLIKHRPIKNRKPRQTPMITPIRRCAKSIITDSKNFPISKTVAAAHAIIEPGAIREMHWHPNADEWSFFIKGRARVTIFASEGTARTFDYVPGDVGIVPRNMGHFVENIGEEPIEMLEVFRADEFRDFSLFQWMGETPKKMVIDHLFAEDPKNGEIFWDKVKSAKKDEVTMPDTDEVIGLRDSEL